MNVYQVTKHKETHKLMGIFVIYLPKPACSRCTPDYKVAIENLTLSTNVDKKSLETEFLTGDKCEQF